MDRQFKRAKTGAVSLTSLLDLLFVMIFVSLLQQKEVTPPPVAKTETKVVTKIVEVEKIVIKEVPAPTPVKKEFKIESINATFDFKGIGLDYKGKYSMKGFVNNETGAINLGTVAWIEKPRFQNKAVQVDMVSLSGSLLEDKVTINGRVDYIGCKEFKLTKLSGDPSSIAGTWKGTYVCSQGPTGLTLTIK